MMIMPLSCTLTCTRNILNSKNVWLVNSTSWLGRRWERRIVLNGGDEVIQLFTFRLAKKARLCLADRPTFLDPCCCCAECFFKRFARVKLVPVRTPFFFFCRTHQHTHSLLSSSMDFTLKTLSPTISYAVRVRHTQNTGHTPESQLGLSSLLDTGLLTAFAIQSQTRFLFCFLTQRYHRCPHTSFFDRYELLLVVIHRGRRQSYSQSIEQHVQR
jgi:hypothetical protein